MKVFDENTDVDCGSLDNKCLLRRCCLKGERNKTHDMATHCMVYCTGTQCRDWANCSLLTEQRVRDTKKNLTEREIDTLAGTATERGEQSTEGLVCLYSFSFKKSIGRQTATRIH